MIPEIGKRYIITGFEEESSLWYVADQSFPQAVTGREVVVDNVNVSNSRIIYVQFPPGSDIEQHRLWGDFKRKSRSLGGWSCVLWYPILSEVLPYTAEQLAEWDAYDLAEE